MNHGASLKDARNAKTKAAKVFHDLVGDVAVGIVPLGDDLYGLKINLTSQPEEGISLPVDVDGVPVRIEVVGTIHKR
jgi:hypothetical protein